MSQDVSNNLGTGQTVIPSSGFWSVETDADHLMNDLFSDLDEMLEKGRKLPEESKSPEYVSLQSVIVPSISLPSPPKPEQNSFSQRVQAAEISAKVGTEVPKSNLASEARKSGRSLDKILFVIACSSLVAVLLWLVSEERLNIPFALNWVQNSSRGLSESDAEFIEYMERSLDVIDRKAQLEQPSSIATLPPGEIPPSTGNVPPTSTQTPTVLERIYIPVYPANPSSPGTPTPASPQSPSQLQPQPQSQPSPTTAQTIPDPSPIPPPPPAQVIPSVPVEIPSIPPTPTAPATKHTLVGLLELGERSAALFNIDGVTQRIRIGESIGGSGWTLVSIANQKAVIRRNGEVRSIFVGQSF